jgi:hypothetical protein
MEAATQADSDSGNGAPTLYVFSGVRPSPGAATSTPSHAAGVFLRAAASHVAAPGDAAPYTYLAELRWLFPLLLWRRGLGRGGPITRIPFSFAFSQQVRLVLSRKPGVLAKTASSPHPSPPKEEREPPLRFQEMHVKYSGDGRTPHQGPGIIRSYELKAADKSTKLHPL